MKKYLVIAIYADNKQRYATEVEAESPEEAEAAAQAIAVADNSEYEEGDEPLTIAGVLAGPTDEDTAKIQVVA